MSLIRDLALRIVGKEHIESIAQSAVDNQSVFQLRQRLIEVYIGLPESALKAVTELVDSSNNMVTRRSQAMKLAKQYGYDGMSSYDAAMVGELLLSQALFLRANTTTGPTA